MGNTELKCNCLQIWRKAGRLREGGALGLGTLVLFGDALLSLDVLSVVFQSFLSIQVKKIFFILRY